MATKLVVHKNRTNSYLVDLGMDISGDTYTSEIRTQPDHESPLLATFTVSFETDGTDGLLRLDVDNLITGQVEAHSGYMDLKRITGTEPVPVFDRPLEVEFRGTVTA